MRFVVRDRGGQKVCSRSYFLHIGTIDRDRALTGDVSDVRLADEVEGGAL